MELYVIYGLPGVGKLAVARELARLRPGYKLFHIHLLADMLEPVFGFDGRGFIRLRDQIWPMVIEQVVADGLPGLVTTFVFERSLPDYMVPNVRDHVVEKGGAVRFVRLVCEKTENERRLSMPPSGLASERSLRLMCSIESLIQVTSRPRKAWGIR